MPRAIWSGSVSFGLVSVPVRMYSAIDEQDRAKAKGETVEPPKAAEREAPPDLMEALRASLDSAKSGDGKKRSRRRPRVKAA